MDPELKLAILGTLTTITSKRIELRFVLLLLLLLLRHEFAHLTKIAITLPFIKLGPPDFARTSRA